MKCAICKEGETNPGLTTLTLERGSMTLVFKSVPAEVCDNCGERYVDGATTDRLLREALTAEEAGVVLKVRSLATEGC